MFTVTLTTQEFDAMLEAVRDNIDNCEDFVRVGIGASDSGDENAELEFWQAMETKLLALL
jgi:hypothetical protein